MTDRTVPGFSLLRRRDSFQLTPEERGASKVAIYLTSISEASSTTASPLNSRGNGAVLRPARSIDDYSGHRFLGSHLIYENLLSPRPIHAESRSGSDRSEFDTPPPSSLHCASSDCYEVSEESFGLENYLGSQYYPSPFNLSIKPSFARLRFPTSSRSYLILRPTLRRGPSFESSDINESSDTFTEAISRLSDVEIGSILTRTRYFSKQKLVAMASSEVDMKFLGQFAKNIATDHPLLARSLNQLMGNLTMLSDYVVKARTYRRLDTTRDTKSVDLYHRIIWYSREGLATLEDFVLPMVASYGELKVLAYKLRSSYYHLYVLFNNSPHISLKRGGTVSTPPGLTSPRALKVDKGKGIDRGQGSPGDPFRPSSVQPTHPLEQGGPVGGPEQSPPPADLSANFLVPSQDFRPIALACFQEAALLAENLLWGSHPLRLSVKVEFCAFLYDCLHERERSRQLAKQTISEVYNAQEGMDDEMFDDAAQLVGILGKMSKRGTGGAASGSAGGSAGGTGSTRSRGDIPVMSPGMDNPI